MSTARRATSRIRPRTSIGWFRKAEEVPITRTCKLLAAVAVAALSWTAPVSAKTVKPTVDPLKTYVEARGAEIEGQEGRSARLFADMAAAQPTNYDLARRAVVSAIQAGDTQLAVSVASRTPRAELGFDGRLVLVADALRRGKHNEALGLLDNGGTSSETRLLAPLVRAWALTEAGKPDGAAELAKVGPDDPLSAVAGIQRTYMLLTLKDANGALEQVRADLKKRTLSSRQRMVLAAGFDRLGRRDAALEMLQGDDGPLLRAKARMARGKLPDIAIDTAAKGFSDVLMALSIDLARDDDKALPIALTRIARHASPADSGSVILLGLFLDGEDRTNDALAILNEVPADDLLAGDALDLQARLLSRADRNQEALAKAQGPASSPDASAEEIGRLGDILGELKRHDEAAAAYARAIARANESGADSDLWTYHLLRASSLEELNRWPEAKDELKAAMALEPDNPVLLNFLGYGKLERGEDLDSAEAMIRKASALRPDDASITDSLGWALFKRGNLPEAIETLRRAAAGDPAQAEIHEHLGDALYTSGRRIEARFAWRAALLTAEDDAKTRLQGKLETGLSSANAAP